MTMIFQENVKMDDLDIPDILYKYRDWSNIYNKTILTQKQIYLASPNEFEDPYDCKIPIRYDLMTDTEIKEKFLRESKNLQGTRAKRRKFAMDRLREGLIKNKEHIENQRKIEFEDYDKKMGVLSLTANPANIKMWESYGANHTGFCVGFNSKMLFKHLGGGGEVTYFNELPIIYPTPKHNPNQQILIRLFSKLNKWIFEQEYRTHRFNEAGHTKETRTITLEKEVYKELIFGALMPDNIKEEIIASLPDELKDIKIRQAVITNDNVTIID